MVQEVPYCPIPPVPIVTEPSHLCPPSHAPIQMVFNHPGFLQAEFPVILDRDSGCRHVLLPGQDAELSRFICLGYNKLTRLDLLLLLE